jgi:hypothetical protein
MTHVYNSHCANDLPVYAVDEKEFSLADADSFCRAIEWETHSCHSSFKAIYRSLDFIQTQFKKAHPQYTVAVTKHLCSCRFYVQQNGHCDCIAHR